MILVWGDRSDAPVEHVLALLQQRQAAVMHIDGARLADLRHDLTLGGTGTAITTGWIESQGLRADVQQLTGIYLRPLPAPPGAAAQAAAAAADVLLTLTANTSAVVINPPAAGLSNHSKPFQLQLIARAGLAVPPTLITSDAQAALDFVQLHGRVVYKSISGVRSVVSTLEIKDQLRLQGLAHGPVQLQRWVAGRDVRVHVVGRRCFATAIDCQATDYRYAARSGEPVQLSPMRIAPALAKTLVGLVHGLGLQLAGVDLRKTPTGDWVCFEVNPSPGFTYCEDATGQPIGDALVDLLLRVRTRPSS